MYLQIVGPLSSIERNHLPIGGSKTDLDASQSGKFILALISSECSTVVEMTTVRFISTTMIKSRMFYLYLLIFYFAGLLLLLIKSVSFFKRI